MENPERLLGITIDTTKSKQAEQALRESEAKFRLAAQAGKMYAYDWDGTTDEVVRSEEFANILSRSEPSCLARQQFLAKIHPEDRVKFSAAVPKDPNVHITYGIFRDDGSVIWMENHGRAFFDPQRRMLRIIGMLVDITERKLVEEKLREMNLALEGQTALLQARGAAESLRQEYASSGRYARP